MTTECTHVEETITHLILGELSPDEIAVIEAHLKRCERCERRRAELEDVVMAIRPKELPADFPQRLSNAHRTRIIELAERFDTDRRPLIHGHEPSDTGGRYSRLVALAAQLVVGASIVFALAHMFKHNEVGEFDEQVTGAAEATLPHAPAPSDGINAHDAEDTVMASSMNNVTLDGIQVAATTSTLGNLTLPAATMDTGSVDLCLHIEAAAELENEVRVLERRERDAVREFARATDAAGEAIGSPLWGSAMTAAQAAAVESRKAMMRLHDAKYRLALARARENGRRAQVSRHDEPSLPSRSTANVSDGTDADAAGITYDINAVVITGDRDAVYQLETWSEYETIASGAPMSVAEIEQWRQRLLTDLREAGHDFATVAVYKHSLSLGFLKFRVHVGGASDNKDAEAQWRTTETTLRLPKHGQRDEHVSRPTVIVGPGLRPALRRSTTVANRHDQQLSGRRDEGGAAAVQAVDSDSMHTDVVGDLLARGRTFFENRRYSEAKEVFQYVLRYDPHHREATRMLQNINEQLVVAAGERLKVAAIRAMPSKQQVDVAGNISVFNDETVRRLQQKQLKWERYHSLSTKLEHVVIPRLRFKDEPANVILEYVRERSREVDPDGEGVALVTSWDDQPRRISLNLDNVPVGDVIRYICRLADLRYRTENGMITIVSNRVPVDTTTRRYPLSPTFMFVEESVGRAPQAFFERCGITFGAGTSIRFDGDTRTLVVTNTPQELNKLEKVLLSVRLQDIGNNFVSDLHYVDLERGHRAYKAKRQLMAKLERIVIPALTVDDMPVDSVFERLKARIREVDLDGDGVNIVVVQTKTAEAATSSGRAATRVTLRESNIAVSDAIKMICEQANLNVCIDSHAVVVAANSAMLRSPTETHIYPMTPTFADVLGGTDPVTFFEQRGIRFEAGASMYYSPKTHVLVMTNTVYELGAVSVNVREINGAAQYNTCSGARFLLDYARVPPGVVIDNDSIESAFKRLENAVREYGAHLTFLVHAPNTATRVSYAAASLTLGDVVVGWCKRAGLVCDFGQTVVVVRSDNNAKLDTRFYLVKAMAGMAVNIQELKTVLMSLGVAFPEGAWVHFDRYWGELVAVNTPMELAKIQRIVSTWNAVRKESP